MRYHRLTMLVLAAVLSFGFSSRLLAQGNHERFDDHDRDAAQHYYDAHKDHPPVGWRQEDRVNADMERHLVAGEVLSAELRAREHTPPHELVVQLGAVPRGDRYVVIGGHLVMVDRGNHIVDVLNINF